MGCGAAHVVYLCGWVVVTNTDAGGCWSTLAWAVRGQMAAAHWSMELCKRQQASMSWLSRAVRLRSMRATAASGRVLVCHAAAAVCHGSAVIGHRFQQPAAHGLGCSEPGRTSDTLLREAMMSCLPSAVHSRLMSVAASPGSHSGRSPAMRGFLPISCCHHAVFACMVH